jgi:hypothetical protein
MVIAEAERGREDRYAALLSRWRTSAAQDMTLDLYRKIVDWEKKSGKRVRGRRFRRGVVFVDALERFAGDLLRARAGDNATGRVYRSIGKTAFGDDPVNYDVFMGVLGGLNRASPSVWPIVIRGWFRLLRPIMEATTQPFAQAIRDLASDHIAAGRAVIIGDAAAIPRPHTAASTSKAAANAVGLTDELQASPKDVPAALARWEPPQVALGKYLR